MSSKQLFEAFSYIDDRYLDIADASVKEEKHLSWRRLTTIALAAALCISLLTVTAMATGWIPGFFASLKEKYPQDAQLFEAAAQANTDAVPEITDIPAMDLSKFVLLERYFDGETILIGYDLDLVVSDPVVGFEPEEALLKHIKKSTRMSSIGWDSREPWMDDDSEGYGVKYNFKQDGYSMDKMMKGTLSPEDYEKAWDILEETGWVCVAIRDAYISDHFLINGYDPMDLYDPETNAYGSRTDYTEEMGTCLRLEPLPEDIKQLESVNVTLKINSTVEYWYLDMMGNGRVYYDSSTQESKEVTFEIERSEGNG